MHDVYMRYTFAFYITVKPNFLAKSWYIILRCGLYINGAAGFTTRQGYMEKKVSNSDGHMATRVIGWPYGHTSELLTQQHQRVESKLSRRATGFTPV